MIKENCYADLESLKNRSTSKWDHDESEMGILSLRLAWSYSSRCRTTFSSNGSQSYRRQCLLQVTVPVFPLIESVYIQLLAALSSI